MIEISPKAQKPQETISIVFSSITHKKTALILLTLKKKNLPRMVLLIIQNRLRYSFRSSKTLLSKKREKTHIKLR